MNKQVIQLHTIDQWMQQDQTIRSLLLQNIKLKDKLYRYLEARSARPALTEPKWVPCRKCDRTGWYAVHPRYPGVHPSQLISPCMLKIYNDVVGLPGEEKNKNRLQLTFDLGHAVHHMFQGYGMDGAWGPHYVPEAPVSGDFQELAEQYMIEGSADADNIMSIDMPDSPYIYEVGLVHEYKSINTDAFNKLARQKSEHQQQATVYSACLNRPVVVYLYFSKNDSNLADFPVEFKPEVWQQVSNKAATIVDFYRRGISPKGETGYHCQDCKYVLSCYDYRNEMLKSPPRGA